jgi:hypothetical protein
MKEKPRDNANKKITRGVNTSGEKIPINNP